MAEEEEHAPLLSHDEHEKNSGASGPGHAEERGEGEALDEQTLLDIFKSCEWSHASPPSVHHLCF